MDPLVTSWDAASSSVEHGFHMPAFAQRLCPETAAALLLLLDGNFVSHPLNTTVPISVAKLRVGVVVKSLEANYNNNSCVY